MWGHFTQGYWEIWCFAMIMFMYLYCSKGQGELLTRQMNAVLHPHHNIGVVLSGEAMDEYVSQSPH